MAPLAAIIAGTGYLTFWKRPSLREIPPWVWAVTAFIMWAWISSFWSPYQGKSTLSNPIKILIGFFIYLGVFLSLENLNQRSLSILSRLVVFAASIIGLLLLVDLSTGLGITNLADPVQPGEDQYLKSIQSMMNLGHSAAILSLLFPLIAWILVRNLERPLVWICAVGTLIFIASLIGRFNVGVISIPLICLAWILATHHPVATVKILIILMPVFILLAPFLGVFMSILPDSFRDALPTSWDHRVEMWTFVTEKISEHVLIGHGFDASRTFNETFVGNGNYEMSIVSLHPHNFGLQIWVETGLIGAVLAAAAILTIADRVTYRVQQTPAIAAPIAGFLIVLIIIGMVSYGVWQEWLWATVVFLSALYSKILSIPGTRS